MMKYAVIAFSAALVAGAASAQAHHCDAAKADAEANIAFAVHVEEDVVEAAKALYERGLDACDYEDVELVLADPALGLVGPGRSFLESANSLVEPK